MFEFDEEKNKYSSMHHPFTSPKEEYIKDIVLNYKKAKAKAYDIVLNGYEIGGGSVRIYNKDLQNKIFNILSLSKKQIDEEFG